MVNLNKKLMSDNGLLKMIVLSLIWLILEVEAAWEMHFTILFMIRDTHTYILMQLINNKKKLGLKVKKRLKLTTPIKQSVYAFHS